MSFSSPMLRAWMVTGLLVAGASGVAEAAFVRQFTPQGQVDRQIRATVVFNADMVPLGRPEAPAPFEVDSGAIAKVGPIRSTVRSSPASVATSGSSPI